MSDEHELEGEAAQQLEVYSHEANILALCRRIIEVVEGRAYFLARFPVQRRCEAMMSVALTAQWIAAYALQAAGAEHLPVSQWEQDQAEPEAAEIEPVMVHPVPPEPPTGDKLN
jgi:hypothetical protein